MTALLANAIGERLMASSDVFVGHSFEHPGYILLLTDGGGCWVIGTANDVWGADLFIDAEGQENGDQPDYSVQTNVSPDEDDAVLIADALFAAMSTLGHNIYTSRHASED